MRALLILALVLSATGCAPSQASIETAVAQTEAAKPTATSVPTATATATPPPAVVDLEAMLLQPGDLPADYQSGQIRRTWPDDVGELPPAAQVRQVGLRAGDFVGDGLTLALYASAAEAEAAYQLLAGRLKAGEAQAQLGTAATVAEARNSVFGVTSVQVVWWECAGVGYLDLLATSYELRETAVTYAQRAADRLKTEACRG